ncbi:MAG: hypothetical protein L0Z50_33210 [Verrucomicrobiales bacterium]|nr:hypothetical protein [Verrucomicrobiales bacterium]
MADGSYWIYLYDTLGQVISGKRKWADHTPVAGQQFEYGFHDIGNRTSTKVGGDAAGANLRSATHTANNLNQYTSRTVPGAVDILGLANSSGAAEVAADVAVVRMSLSACRRPGWWPSAKTAFRVANVKRPRSR